MKASYFVIIIIALAAAWGVVKKLSDDRARGYEPLQFYSWENGDDLRQPWLESREQFIDFLRDSKSANYSPPDASRVLSGYPDAAGNRTSERRIIASESRSGNATTLAALIVRARSAPVSPIAPK